MSAEDLSVGREHVSPVPNPSLAPLLAPGHLSRNCPESECPTYHPIDSSLPPHFIQASQLIQRGTVGRVVYDSGVHGFSTAAFRQCCTNVEGPTISVIGLETGELFGGVTYIPWIWTKATFELLDDPRDFIFTLRNNCDVTPTPFVERFTATELGMDIVSAPRQSSAERWGSSVCFGHVRDMGSGYDILVDLDRKVSRSWFGSTCWRPLQTEHHKVFGGSAESIISFVEVRAIEDHALRVAPDTNECDARIMIQRAETVARELIKMKKLTLQLHIDLMSFQSDTVPEETQLRGHLKVDVTFGKMLSFFDKKDFDNQSWWMVPGEVFLRHSNHGGLCNTRYVFAVVSGRYVFVYYYHEGNTYDEHWMWRRPLFQNVEEVLRQLPDAWKFDRDWKAPSWELIGIMHVQPS